MLWLQSKKYGEQYRFVFGGLLSVEVWADEDKSPLQALSPVTSLCPEANEGLNVIVLIVIEV